MLLVIGFKLDIEYLCEIDLKLPETGYQLMM